MKQKELKVHTKNSETDHLRNYGEKKRYQILLKNDYSFQSSTDLCLMPQTKFSSRLNPKIRAKVQLAF